MAVAVAACDQGKQHDTQVTGPFVHLVAANVGTNTPLPSNGTIRLTFDRLLDPITVVRQSFAIVRKNGDLAANPVVIYDPVARTVSLVNPDPKGAGAPWLTDSFYTLVIGVADTSRTSGGVRAIDGEPLDPSTRDKLAIGFAIAPAAGVASAPQVDFCRDIQPLFLDHCSAGTCHGAPNGSGRPAAGLILETAAGIRHTAIGLPAHGANTAGPALPYPPQAAFAANMPIIEANGSHGDPSNSWLMYKLLLAVPPPSADAPESIFPGEHAPHSFVDAANPPEPMSDDDRAVLSDYVLGREMPFPSSPGGLAPGQVNDNPPFTLEQLERVRVWIEAGAGVPDNECSNPRSCASSADCSDEVCDTLSMAGHAPRFICIQCTQNADCRAGTVCSEEQCVPGCAANSDCAASPSIPICDPNAGTNGRCVQCLIDQDCKPGQTCTTQSCR